MNFVDASFAPFLVAVLLAMSLVRSQRAQVGVLLGASYLFYCWWDPRFLFLIVGSSLVDFTVGRRIHEAREPRRRRTWLIVSLSANLGLLGVFKYADFAIGSLNDVLGIVGSSATLPYASVTLPVGISFYTFQTLSYSLDIYYRRLEPEPRLVNFLSFVAAFPQLVAGPIVRARDLLPQLRQPFVARAHPSGLFYILFGLAKKLLLADQLAATVVDPVFANPALCDSGELLLATYGFGLQIFLDFSAYSDIAIGIGRLIGLELPENFRAPYLARSFSEFWRRWHISLSTWFRDYLYVPLGGNRVSAGRWALNIVIVFAVSGLWHGAKWTFVIWGLVHGIALIAERVWSSRISPERFGRWRGALGWLVTVQVTMAAWIFFRARDLTSAFDVYRGIAALEFSVEGTYFNATTVGLLLTAAVLHVGLEPGREGWAQTFGRWPAVVQAASLFCVFTAAYWVAETEVVHRAFIYFQF